MGKYAMNFSNIPTDALIDELKERREVIGLKVWTDEDVLEKLFDKGYKGDDAYMMVERVMGLLKEDAGIENGLYDIGRNNPVDETIDYQVDYVIDTLNDDTVWGE